MLSISVHICLSSFRHPALLSSPESMNLTWGLGLDMSTAMRARSLTPLPTLLSPFCLWHRPPDKPPDPLPYPIFFPLCFDSFLTLLDPFRLIRVLPLSAPFHSLTPQLSMITPSDGPPSPIINFFALHPLNQPLLSHIMYCSHNLSLNPTSKGPSYVHFLLLCAIPSWACSPFPNALSIASICQIVLPFFVPQYFLIHSPSFATDQEYLLLPHQCQHCCINSHCCPNQHCTEPLILATMPNTLKHKHSKQEMTPPLVMPPLPHSQTPCHPSHSSIWFSSAPTPSTTH